MASGLHCRHRGQLNAVARFTLSRDGPNAVASPARDDGSALTVGGPNAVYHNCNDGRAYTAPAGSLQRNGFGLHDMIGNVYEWVEDCYVFGYASSAGDATAVKTPDCKHVIRGGAWMTADMLLRMEGRRTEALVRYAAHAGLTPFDPLGYGNPYAMIVEGGGALKYYYRNPRGRDLHDFKKTVLPGGAVRSIRSLA